MEHFVWCSPHTPTEEQIHQLLAGGNSEVLYMKDLNKELFERVCKSPDNYLEMSELASNLIDYMVKNNYRFLVQPAGSPTFQTVLGMSLMASRVISDMLNMRHPLTIVNSHSDRVSVDAHNPDGSVTKTSMFKHIKFISI